MPLFSHKNKVIIEAGISLVIAIGVTHKQPNTLAAFHENKIIIYSEKNYDRDDDEIIRTLLHEFDHAYTNLIHNIRWHAGKNEIPEKYKKMTDVHTLTFYPYSGKEEKKYKALLKKGKDRVYDFAFLLQKVSKEEILSEQEKIRFEKYRTACSGHIKKRHSQVIDESIIDTRTIDPNSGPFLSTTQLFSRIKLFLNLV